jgi:hypothetical protein
MFWWFVLVLNWFELVCTGVDDSEIHFARRDENQNKKKKKKKKKYSTCFFFVFHTHTEEEEALIKLAQQASLEDAAKRNTALRRLEQRLECPWNLSINPNTDDQGNCQFDSAADQLRRFPEFASIDKVAVRARVVAWMRANRNYRLSDEPGAESLEEWILITQGLSWDDYCDKMARDKVWGDEVTMKAITEAFGVRIFLWSSTVSESNYFSEHVPRAIKTGAAPDRSLLMCHVLEVHYCSLRLKTPPSQMIVPDSVVAPPSVPADAQLRLLQALFATPPVQSPSSSSSLSASRPPPLDRYVVEPATKSVVVDDDKKTVWSAHLHRNTRRAHHFYVLQLLRDTAGGYVCYARWGIAPHAGQFKSTRFAVLADAKNAFEAKFVQKVGIAWSQRHTAAPVSDPQGRLYLWSDSDAGGSASVPTDAPVPDEAQRALTASLIARVAADASQPALAIGKLVDLSSGRACVLPSSSEPVTVPAAVSPPAENPRTSDEELSDDFVLLDTVARTHTLALRRGWHNQHTLVACFFEYAVGSAAAAASASDWIGLYDVGSETRSYLRYWKTAGATHGFVSELLSRKHFGALELRLIRGGDYTELARSEPFTHGPRLLLRATCEGNRVVVSWQDEWQFDATSGATEAECIAAQRALWRTTSDWLGLYLVRTASDKRAGAEDDDDDDDASAILSDSQNGNYLQSVYMSSADACTFNRPTVPGEYEVRFFSSYRKYHCLSRVRICVE